MSEVITYKTVTIANGQTVSDAEDLEGMTLCGFFTPASLTGTAMTFQTAPNAGATFLPVKEVGGAALSYTVASSGYYICNPSNFAGIRYIKFVSGSSETGAKIITLALRETY